MTQGSIAGPSAQCVANVVAPALGIVICGTKAIDLPGGEESKSSGAILGLGPVLLTGATASRGLNSMIAGAAKSARLPYQTKVANRSETQASLKMQLAAGGLDIALIGVPIKYLGSPCEVFDLKDVESAVRLVEASVRAFQEGSPAAPASRQIGV